jgi:hypothetical protein
MSIPINGRFRVKEYQPPFFHHSFGRPEEVCIGNILGRAIMFKESPCLRLQRQASAGLADEWLFLIQPPVNKWKPCQLNRDAETTGPSTYHRNIEPFRCLFRFNQCVSLHFVGTLRVACLIPEIICGISKTYT